MASTIEEKRGRWIKRFRRKNSQPSESENSDRLSGGSRKKNSPKLFRSRTDINIRREEIPEAREILPSRLEKQISALAETSGNMRKMSVELDTHQKCVTNLAATVVRQNNQIREMKQYIMELEAALTNQSRCSCCRYSPGPLSQSSYTSESSKENVFQRNTSAGDLRHPDVLEAMMDEASARIEKENVGALDPVKDATRHHLRALSDSGEIIQC